MTPLDPHNAKGYYKLIDRQPVEVQNLLDWARWMESADRHVRLTRVGPYTVSTIFLGLDHGFGSKGPPVLFETMARIDREHELPAVPSLGIPAWKMDREFEDFQDRCCTWDEAVAMHEAAIAHFRQPGDAIEEVVPFQRELNETLTRLEKQESESAND